ncbi:MAG: methyl-accepting chemotaxis protein [Lachnospiraceae bacterium]|nr:methyl-accepting chemotaxis protein [Lachnospiraceae bacterium]
MKKSLGRRLTAVVCVAVVVVALLVGLVAIQETSRVTTADAEELMMAMSELQASKVNNTIQRIEQSVDTLADITRTTIADFAQFKLDKYYVNRCTNAIETTALELGSYTEGAMTVYIRYNPVFTEPTSGLFLVKGERIFKKETPTDFSMYDPSDLEHVGWYYIPVNAGKAVWMDPYLNENVNLYMISYVVPLTKEGTNVGIVGMDVNFSDIQAQVESVKLYETGYAYLINTENKILVHRDHATGTSLEEVLPEDFAILQDAEKEGMLVEAGKNSIIYTTLQNGMKMVVSVPQSELQATTNTLTQKIVVVMLVVIAVSGILAMLFAKSISTPIKKLTGVIRVTADLDFATKLDTEKLVKQKDEIGDMAKAILHMRESLIEMVRDINLSCSNLVESAATLQETSKGIDEIAENNSALTEELAAGMEQTGEAASQIQQNLTEIQENAVSIEKLSDDGYKLSKEIEDRAAALASSTQEASDKTKEMYDTVKKDTELALEKSKAVEQINQLTNAIAEISTQTSLLALNASIEAARAGEAGRGFAVVATEISKLAQQTNDTVENINQIVGEVNEAVLDMAKCLDVSMEFIADTVLEDYENFGKVSEQYQHDADIVEDSMSEVNTAIVKLAENIAQIKTAMDGIGITVNEAGISINEIATSTQNMAEKTGQNKQVADGSVENVEMLNNIVARFKMEE